MLFLVAACNRPAGSDLATIEPEITPQPAHVGPATIAFKLKDAAGNRIAGANVSLEGNMSHPGMAPVFADAKEVATGEYSCPFQFSMAGDWVITVRVVMPDGQKLERQFAVKGVRAD